MPDGGDASGPVDVEAAVVVARTMGLARMEPDPHPDHDVIGPRFGRDRSLRLDGRPDSGDRLREDREQGVSLCPDGRPAVGGDRPTDQLEVSSIEVVPSCPECASEGHRTLDVRAQEGDRARREVAAPEVRRGGHG